MHEPTGKDQLEDGWTQADLEYWSDRLGNMALSQTNNTKLEHVTSFRERRDRMLIMSASKRFPLTRQLEDIVTCTPQTLAGRQQETVERIAQY